MSINDDRPGAVGDGAGDQNKSEWEPRCSDFTAASPTGQTPPDQFPSLVSPHLPGFEKIQEITDLTFDELPSTYQAAIRRLKKDPALFRLFEKIAFIQITRLRKTSADKIEGEIRVRYEVEFCHFTRTLMGRLFLWKHPHFEGRMSAKRCILDALAPSVKEELILITE